MGHDWQAKAALLAAQEAIKSSERLRKSNRHDDAHQPHLNAAVFHAHHAAELKETHPEKASKHQEAAHSHLVAADALMHVHAQRKPTRSEKEAAVGSLEEANAASRALHDPRTNIHYQTSWAVADNGDKNLRSNTKKLGVASPEEHIKQANLHRYAAHTSHMAAKDNEKKIIGGEYARRSRYHTTRAVEHENLAQISRAHQEAAEDLKNPEAHQRVIDHVNNYYDLPHGNSEDRARVKSKVGGYHKDKLWGLLNKSLDLLSKARDLSKVAYYTKTGKPALKSGVKKKYKNASEGAAFHTQRTMDPRMVKLAGGGRLHAEAASAHVGASFYAHHAGLPDKAKFHLEQAERHDKAAEEHGHKSRLVTNYRQKLPGMRSLIDGTHHPSFHHDRQQYHQTRAKELSEKEYPGGTPRAATKILKQVDQKASKAHLEAANHHGVAQDAHLSNNKHKETATKEAMAASRRAVEAENITHDANPVAKRRVEEHMHKLQDTTYAIGGTKMHAGLIKAVKEDFEPHTPSQHTPSEPGYVYHATNEERAHDVAQGHLKTHKPWEYTDQRAWPDGSTEKRSYWSKNAATTHYFAPEEGNAVIIRTKHTPSFGQEQHTKDVYSTKPIHAKHIEIKHKNGDWVPLHEAYGGSIKKAINILLKSQEKYSLANYMHLHPYTYPVDKFTPYPGSSKTDPKGHRAAYHATSARDFASMKPRAGAKIESEGHRREQVKLEREGHSGQPHHYRHLASFSAKVNDKSMMDHAIKLHDEAVHALPEDRKRAYTAAEESLKHPKGSIERQDAAVGLHATGIPHMHYAVSKEIDPKVAKSLDHDIFKSQEKYSLADHLDREAPPKAPWRDHHFVNADHHVRSYAYRHTDYEPTGGAAHTMRKKYETGVDVHGEPSPRHYRMVAISQHHQKPSGYPAIDKKMVQEAIKLHDKAVENLPPEHRTAYIAAHHSLSTPKGSIERKDAAVGLHHHGIQRYFPEVANELGSHNTSQEHHHELRNHYTEAASTAVNDRAKKAARKAYTSHGHASHLHGLAHKDQMAGQPAADEPELAKIHAKEAAQHAKDYHEESRSHHVEQSRRFLGLSENANHQGWKDAYLRQAKSHQKAADKHKEAASFAEKQQHPSVPAKPVQQTVFGEATRASKTLTGFDRRFSEKDPELIHQPKIPNSQSNTPKPASKESMGKALVAKAVQEATKILSKPKIAAVDLDGTILSQNKQCSDKPGKPIKGVVEKLRRLKSLGWTIVIWTVRQDSPELQAHLNRYSIPFDYVNWHPWQPKGGSSKILADVYLDDRAVPFSGDAKDYEEILIHKPWWEKR